MSRGTYSHVESSAAQSSRGAGREYLYCTDITLIRLVRVSTQSLRFYFQKYLLPRASSLFDLIRDTHNAGNITRIFMREIELLSLHLSFCRSLEREVTK